MHPLFATGHAGLLRGNATKWIRCISCMTSSSNGTSQGARELHPWALPALCGAVAAGGAMMFMSCNAEAPAKDGPFASQADKSASFRAWVSRNGGDASAVDVASSKVGAGWRGTWVALRRLPRYCCRAKPINAQNPKFPRCSGRGHLF